MEINAARMTHSLGRGVRPGQEWTEEDAKQAGGYLCGGELLIPYGWEIEGYCLLPSAFASQLILEHQPTALSDLAKLEVTTEGKSKKYSKKQMLELNNVNVSVVVSRYEQTVKGIARVWFSGCKLDSETRAAT